ncbi:MAG TPA: LPS assembly lipoprotein LptE, partial [bacterium]
IFFDPKTNVVLQYQLSVVYDIAAVDQREKKTFSEDVGRTSSVYYYTPQYVGAASETKDQAISRMAGDIAQSIVRRVLEGF